MTTLPPSFDRVPLTRVSDGDYRAAALDVLRASRHRALCSLFIVDHALDRDPALQVDALLMELAAARWRGVDARLLIGGSRTNRLIERATLLAQARARDLGIACRLAAAAQGSNTHVKLVVADDWVLLGSHNWSSAILGSETQDSVLLQHAAVGAWLRTYFESSWAEARDGEYDVSV